jgi:hypothetical protein
MLQACGHQAMSTIDQPSGHPSHSLWSTRRVLKTCLVTVVLAGGAYILTRHTEHVIRYLPLLIVLACPLMHVFMHRGHRHH